MKDKSLLASGVVLLLVLVLLAGCIVPAGDPTHLTLDMTVERQGAEAPPVFPEAASRGTYNTACYMEQGGAGFVCDSGGSITMNSGSTLTVASGATETHTASLAANGGITVDTTNFTVSGTTGAVTTASSVSADSAVIGGGWSVGGGGSGCTLSAAGGLGCDATGYFGGTLGVTGAVTMTSSMSADSVAVGGGWSVGGGGSGCTLSSAGGLGCDATGYFGGTLGVTGAVTMTGSLAANGGITVDTTNFTVDGSTGAVATASTITAAGDVTISADTTGGNAGAKNEFIGLPRITLIGGGQGTNPASQTIPLVDDSPAGEYAAVDGDVVLSTDGTIYKYGSGSLKAVWAATAAATDGFLDAGLGAAAAWDDMESAGLLVYSTATWAAGDLTLVLTDDGGARTHNIPALTSANKWTWLEVNIAASDLSLVSDVAILMSAQGETALGAFTMYLDIMYVWDSVDEEALGVAIQQDGVLGVINTETGASLVELTDYIVHYEAGSDFIVYITDQSAADIAILAAY